MRFGPGICAALSEADEFRASDMLGVLGGDDLALALVKEEDRGAKTMVSV